MQSIAEPQYLTTVKFRQSQPDVIIKAAARVPRKAHAEVLTRTCKAVEHLLVQRGDGTMELTLPEEDGKPYTTFNQAQLRPDKPCTLRHGCSLPQKAEGILAKTDGHTALWQTSTGFVGFCNHTA